MIAKAVVMVVGADIMTPHTNHMIFSNKHNSKIIKRKKKEKIQNSKRRILICYRMNDEAISVNFFLAVKFNYRMLYKYE